MLLGSNCVVCDRPGEPLCPTCAGGLVAAPALTPPPPLRSCTGLLAYDGAARQLVVGIKYRNSRALVGRLGERLAQQVANVPFDVVTWAPTSPGRRRARGFDQAELLARAVARRSRRPCRALLERGAGPAQTGRSAQARLVGPSFRVAAGEPGQAVLLVDDVSTTGATLTAAATALLEHGAATVDAAVLAVTPSRVGAVPADGHQPEPLMMGVEQ
jgi:ComF family protein